MHKQQLVPACFSGTGLRLFGHLIRLSAQLVGVNMGDHKNGFEQLCEMQSLSVAHATTLAVTLTSQVLGRKRRKVERGREREFNKNKPEDTAKSSSSP